MLSLAFIRRGNVGWSLCVTEYDLPISSTPDYLAHHRKAAADWRNLESLFDHSLRLGVKIVDLVRDRVANLGWLRSVPLDPTFRNASLFKSTRLGLVTL
jgi:hypothetical protein